MARLLDFTEYLTGLDGAPELACYGGSGAPVTFLFQFPLPAAAVLLSGLLLSTSPLLQAQQPLSLAEAAGRGSTIFEQSAATGMVLVVVRNHDVMVKGYGETFPGSGQRPNSTSLIRLCSISKVFAGELLMELANEGKVALTDPLQRFAPPKTIVPSGPGGTPITLRDLATHTAGLPREVGSYPAKTPHFTFPDQAFRWKWLTNQRLITRPGTAALYSNVGFDFLGDALASAANKTYVQLLNERIVRPLGLRDTTLTPSGEQCARLLRGTGDEGPCTDTQASAASGGVYASSADMARVLQYLLHIPGASAQVGPAFTVYLKPAELKSAQGLSHAGDPTGIGLGWIQLGDPDSPSVLLEKTGGGAGFQTYIALSLKRQTGIFLAVTEGKGRARINFFHEANNLLAAVADVPPLPPRVQRVRASKKKKPSRVHPPASATPR
jgi:D-alanyl-D-alanine-carboxypeptidase/D-alanyl-D-alanine-endopeptidase